MKTASRPLFVFAGGGSGGHLQPGLAVAAELQRLLPGAEALFLCSAREVDRRILSAAAADNPWLDWAPTAGARGGTGLWRLGEPLRLGRESLRAYRRLRTRRPMVVTGLGARASIAGCVAARLLGVPLVLLEFNVIPGAATRLLSLIATECLTGLPVGEVSARGLHCPLQHAGVPVRASIAGLHSELYISEPGLPRLLVLGGSQGAEEVNQLVLEALSGGVSGQVLPPDWQIVHQAGEAAAAGVRERYARLGWSVRVESYLGDMVSELRAATLVISRAGAGTLAELACARRPAILLPLRAAAGDHQRKNAEYFVTGLAAELVAGGLADAAAVVQLRGLMGELSRDADRRQRMSVAAARLAVPDAAARAASAILNIAAISAR